jgi:hypothetical protein
MKNVIQSSVHYTSEHWLANYIIIVLSNFLSIG